MTTQASKRERNDHGSSILKFINKLQVLYRIFIQYVLLPIGASGGAVG
jgi:hypothetical protein